MRNVARSLHDLPLSWSIFGLGGHGSGVYALWMTRLRRRWACIGLRGAYAAGGPEQFSGEVTHLRFSIQIPPSGGEVTIVQSTKMLVGRGYASEINENFPSFGRGSYVRANFEY